MDADAGGPLSGVNAKGSQMLTVQGALEHGLRVMEYRPRRGTDPAVGRSYVVVDVASGEIVQDPVVDSISVTITADGPRATVIVSRYEGTGFPGREDNTFDRAAIMPFSVLKLGDLAIPITAVSCADRVSKISVTFTHFAPSSDWDGFSVPGVPDITVRSKVRPGWDDEAVVRTVKGSWGEADRQMAFKPNQAPAVE